MNMTSHEITAEMIEEMMNDTTQAMNTAWILLNGMLVFFMQAGFTVLECGSVKAQNVVTVLIQNFGTTVIVFTVYYFSWGFAFGYSGSGFSGTSNFFLINDENHYALWFWHSTFAAAACSIFSGSILERVKAGPHLFVCVILSTFVYPLVSHWIWSKTGWLSKSSSNPFLGGSLDFAGCGVVHLFGGTAALAGAYFAGPRQVAVDRKTGKLNKPQGHSLVLQGLGVIILWFGWYGFNMGSTVSLSNGSGKIASLVGTNTSLAGSVGGITSMLVYYYFKKEFPDVPSLMNGILAAMAAVTSGCANYRVWAAIICGAGAGITFQVFDVLVAKFMIDDPVSAIGVHLGGGVWGLICAGLLVSENNMKGALFGNPKLLAANIVEILVIFFFVGSISSVLFGGLKFFGLLRASLQEEAAGLDLRLGISAYPEINEMIKNLNEVTEFDRLIDDPSDITVWLFRKYLEIEKASDLLDFVLICKNFKEFSRRTLVDMKLSADSLEAVEKLRLRIRKMFEYVVKTYLSKDATNMVSISQHILNEINTHYNTNTIPPIGVFDFAEKEISGLLRNGSYKRFVQECASVSKDLKSTVDEAKLPRPNMDAIAEEENLTGTSKADDEKVLDDVAGEDNLYKNFTDSFSLVKAYQDMNNLGAALAPKYRMDPEDGKISWVSGEWFQNQIREAKEQQTGQLPRVAEESKSDGGSVVVVEFARKFSNPPPSPVPVTL